MAKKKVRKIESVVPDTSVIAEGLVTRYIKQGRIRPKKIIIPEAVVNELEHQANQGRETGYIGLDEVRALQHGSIPVIFLGDRPGEFEIKHAKSGAVDNLIREIARKTEAHLMTADKKEPDDPLKRFFDNTTMSVHFKEDATTIAKKGRPGAWKFVQLKHKPDREHMQSLAKAIVETTQHRTDGFIEIERKGSTIVQLGHYRIVIVRPPFGSCWEITAVKPVAHLSLKDYKFPEKFKERIELHAEGILVAGSPGEGKSTFTQALGEFYASKEKIVKTVEAPRDLVLPETITQYSLGHASPEEIRDVLLLNRPDYTIYDEIRNTRDFQLFADLRLSGVGMIGVVHATAAVDAIQRFVGRIELGMIPQVIDTVVFIKAGAIEKVYSLEMKVKVPAGMTEADLARPVVLVMDFYTGKHEYELYTYGEQTVVVPVTEQQINPLHRLAAEALEDYFSRFASRVKVEVVSDNKAVVRVPESKIASIIGKGGSTIELIEKDLGISIDIQSLSDGQQKKQTEISWEASMQNKNITIELDNRYANKEVHLYEGKHYLMSAIAGKKAQIRVSHKSGIGKAVRRAIEQDRLEIRA